MNLLLYYKKKKNCSAGHQCTLLMHKAKPVSCSEACLWALVHKIYSTSQYWSLEYFLGGGWFPCSYSAWYLPRRITTELNKLIFVYTPQKSSWKHQSVSKKCFKANTTRRGEDTGLVLSNQGGSQCWLEMEERTSYLLSSIPHMTSEMEKIWTEKAVLGM